MTDMSVQKGVLFLRDSSVCHGQIMGHQPLDVKSVKRITEGK